MKIPSTKTLQRIFNFISIIFGATTLFNYRHRMGSDGIHYSDIGSAFFRNDWDIVANGFFSPLYSFFIGGIFKILNPPIFLEFPSIQLLNFLIYLLTLWSFQYFLNTLLINLAIYKKYLTSINLTSIPSHVFIFFSYSLFLWTVLILHRVERVTPDLTIFALFLLALGTLFRIQNDKINKKRSFCLGATLGFAYLAKAIMFPISLSIIGFLFLKTIIERKKFSYFFITVFTFFLIASPYIIFLSSQKNHLTTGESGKWHYAMHVHRINSLYYWQGQGNNNGSPQNPITRIFQNPNTYTYNRDGNITHALMFEPSYWTKGLKVHFKLKDILHNLKFTTYQYRTFFWKYQKNIIICFLIFLLLSRNLRAWRYYFQITWLPIMPCFIGLSLYLMLNLIPRYLGLFILPLWLILFAGVSFRPGLKIKLFILMLIGLSLLPYWQDILIRQFLCGKHIAGQIYRKEDLWENSHYEVARILKQKGFQARDPIAFIGVSTSSFWVRLLRLKIIADVPDTDQVNLWNEKNLVGKGNQAEIFWNSPPDIQRQVLNALKKTGAKAVFTETPPKTDGWEQIGNSRYYTNSIK